MATIHYNQHKFGVIGTPLDNQTIRKRSNITKMEDCEYTSEIEDCAIPQGLIHDVQHILVVNNN